MFGFTTRKDRHFKLYTAIVAQQMALRDGTPEGGEPEDNFELLSHSWELAWMALRRWEMINEAPPHSFPRQ